MIVFFLALILATVLYAASLLKDILETLEHANVLLNAIHYHTLETKQGVMEIHYPNAVDCLEYPEFFSGKTS